jgi:acyl-CoA thioester hydrolase
MTTAMPPMADGCHRHGLRIYVEDTDAGGIVYHANYLRYAERGRSEALRVMGCPHAEMIRLHGRMFVVRRAELDYERPAMLDNWITVETMAITVTAAKVRLRQTILREAMILVRISLDLACVTTAEGKPVRLPQAMRVALESMRDAAAPAGLANGRTGQQAGQQADMLP